MAVVPLQYEMDVIGVVGACRNCKYIRREHVERFESRIHQVTPISIPAAVRHISPAHTPAETPKVLGSCTVQPAKLLDVTNTRSGAHYVWPTLLRANATQSQH